MLNLSEAKTFRLVGTSGTSTTGLTVGSPAMLSPLADWSLLWMQKNAGSWGMLRQSFVPAESDGHPVRVEGRFRDFRDQEHPETLCSFWVDYSCIRGYDAVPVVWLRCCPERFLFRKCYAKKKWFFHRFSRFTPKYKQMVYGNCCMVWKCMVFCLIFLFLICFVQNGRLLLRTFATRAVPWSWMKPARRTGFVSSQTDTFSQTCGWHFSVKGVRRCSPGMICERYSVYLYIKLRLKPWGSPGPYELYLYNLYRE